MPKILTTLCCLAFLFMAESDQLLAQTIIPVEPGWNTLNAAVAANINPDNTPINPDVIFQLKRGGRYLLNGMLDIIGWQLQIVGEDGDGPPPVLQPAVNQSGSSAQHFRCGDMLLKNVYILAIDDAGNLKNRIMAINKDSAKVVWDNCVFEYSYLHVVNNIAKYINYHVTNCIFRNMQHNPNWDNGRVIDCRGNPIESIYFENCTFENMNNDIYTGWEIPIKHFYFNHNTVVNHVNRLWATGKWVQATFTNNLFVDAAMKGWTPLEVRPDSMPNGLIYVDSLGTGTPFTEAERNFLFSHNNWYLSPRITDWYASIDTLQAYPMFNDSTQALIDRHPGLVAEKNTAIDPKFNNQPATTDSLNKYCNQKRTKPAPSYFAEIFWDPDSAQRVDTWPLPENLAYTEPTLLTAGNDGFPLGDLNWFPDKKAEWETWKTAVEKNRAGEMPVQFALAQNYPNPFNPSTSIQFQLIAPANVKLEIFNVIGQKVKTLLNQKMAAGAHRAVWDGLDDAGQAVGAGIYYYRLSTNQNVSTRKMVLLK